MPSVAVSYTLGTIHNTHFPSESNSLGESEIDEVVMKHKRKEELNGKWKQVAAKAVTDDNFRKKLAKNPITVMKENDLALPEGIEARLEAGYEIKLFTGADAPEELKEEVKWWKVRVDMIREFGKDVTITTGTIAAPETEDGV